MRVLYIHMIGSFGGASRSLLELVRSLTPDTIEPFFVMPAGSAAKEIYKVSSNIITVWGISQFDNTKYSRYRGMRWLILVREIAYLPSTVFGLLYARWLWGNVDIIHINEVTGVLPWLMARLIFKAPVVVHVRSVVNNDQNSFRTRMISSLLKSYAEAVVAIDYNVRNSLPSDQSVYIIHNSYTNTVVESNKQFLHILKKLKPNSFRVGFVGNLLRVKGLIDLIEAAKILYLEDLNIEYIIVGDQTRDSKGMIQKLVKRLGLSQDIKEDIYQLIAQYGLMDKFHFTGFTNDITSVYSQMNVLCFPSHFDAPGRPIFEAAFSCVPSIACVSSPCEDTIIEGQTCLTVSPKDPVALANAIRSLANNPEFARTMGVNAQILAHKNFNINTNAKKMLDIYIKCHKTLPQKS